MAGVVLATGIVELIPSLRGAQKRIQRELGGVDTRGVGLKIGQGLGNGVAGAFRSIVAPALAAAASIGIAKLSKDAVSAYSELEDSTAAAGVVFGKEMTGIIQQSKTAGRELGLTQQQVINAANTYGTYGKAAGLAGQDLATFATDFTGLAADMASFKGTSPEQAIEAIGAALRGETEPIRAYGVMLDDASMRQKALELGIVDTTKNALTPQQKILAAQALIFEQTADAQGDFARTSDSTANVAKTLSAETENLSAKFGQVLAPAFTAARTRALGLVTGVSGLLDTVIEFQQGTAFTPDLVKALGLDPSQGFGLAVNEGIGGIMAFGHAFKRNDGDITSSGFPGWMEGAGFKVRGALDSMRTSARNFFSSLGPEDFVPLKDFFGAVVNIATPAAPILVEIAKGLGGMSTEIGQLIAAGLPLLIPLMQGTADVLNLLADNGWALNTLLGVLVVSWGAFKTAQTINGLATTVTNFQSLAGAVRGVAGASTAATVPTAAAAGATGALGTAAGGATITTRLLGAAVKALPFVGLAALIVGAVTGLILFFTETEQGREIVANVWGFIQGAVGGVVDWFTGTALPAVGGVLSSIGGFFTGLYNDHVLPVTTGISTVVGGVVTWFQTSVAPPLGAIIGGIGGFFSGLYNGVIVPVFGGIATVIGGFWLFFRGIFQVVRSLIVNIIGPAFLNFWNGVIAPVFTWIGQKIGQWWTAAGIIFGIAVAFVRNTLGGVFTWFRDSIITPVFDFIGGIIDTQVRGWTIVFGVAGDFLRRTLGPAFTWLRDNIITPVFDGISGTIDTVWRTGIKPVFDTIADVVENKLPDAFEGGIGFIEDIWGGLLEVLKAPVRWAVNDVINGGIIKAFNTVAGWLPDVDPLPDVALPRGFYQGGRTGGRPDEVRGVVHGAEAVIPHKATAKVDREHPGLIDALIAGNTSYLGAPMPGSLPFIYGGHQQLANKANAMGFYPFGGYPLSTVQQATSAWVGRAGINPFSGPISAMPREYGIPTIGVGYAPMPGNAIGYYSGGMIGMSNYPNQLGILVHEIGHALGLHHNTGNHSVMNPALGGGGAFWPTAYDTANLQRIYGPPGAGAATTGAPEDGGGGGFIDWLADLFNVDDIIGSILGDSFAADLVRGIGRKLVDVVVDSVRGLFGGGDSAGVAAAGSSAGLGAMLFDGGGFLPYTGEDAIAVQHKKRDPDAVLTGNQWRDVRSIVAERADTGDRIENNFYDANYDQATEIVEQINYSVRRKRRGGANNRRRIPA